jgi:hypothetical protein
MIQCIEKIRGDIRICKDNLFLGSVTDMDELDFWEERLERLEEPHAITFYLKKGKVEYNLYCNSKRKGGSFR